MKFSAAFLASTILTAFSLISSAQAQCSASDYISVAFNGDTCGDDTSASLAAETVIYEAMQQAISAVTGKTLSDGEINTNRNSGKGKGKFVSDMSNAKTKEEIVGRAIGLYRDNNGNGNSNGRKPGWGERQLQTPDCPPSRACEGSWCCWACGYCSRRLQLEQAAGRDLELTAQDITAAEEQVCDIIRSLVESGNSGVNCLEGAELAECIFIDLSMED